MVAWPCPTANELATVSDCFSRDRNSKRERGTDQLNHLYLSTGFKIMFHQNLNPSAKSNVQWKFHNWNQSESFQIINWRNHKCPENWFLWFLSWWENARRLQEVNQDEISEISQAWWEKIRSRKFTFNHTIHICSTQKTQVQITKN